MAGYNIYIDRVGEDWGWLYYEGGITLRTQCWYAADVRIPPGTYEGCAKTYLDRAYTIDKKTGKKSLLAGTDWQGIFIPQPSGNGYVNEIFIHKGTGPGDSRGCIIVRHNDLMAIWNDITPREKPIVTVTIYGLTATAPPK
jgi:hypothetical protein